MLHEHLCFCLLMSITSGVNLARILGDAGVYPEELVGGKAPP